MIDLDWNRWGKRTLNLSRNLVNSVELAPHSICPVRSNPFPTIALYKSCRFKLIWDLTDSNERNKQRRYLHREKLQGIWSLLCSLCSSIVSQRILLHRLPHLLPRWDQSAREAIRFGFDQERRELRRAKTTQRGGYLLVGSPFLPFVATKSLEEDWRRANKK